MLAKGGGKGKVNYANIKQAESFFFFFAPDQSRAR
jgi:hypothetical protein